MTIAERQGQIVRIRRAQRVQPELTVQLEDTLRQAVIGITQIPFEAALVEELQAERVSKGFKGARCSGYFQRSLGSH